MSSNPLYDNYKAVGDALRGAGASSDVFASLSLLYREAKPRRKLIPRDVSQEVLDRISDRIGWNIEAIDTDPRELVVECVNATL